MAFKKAERKNAKLRLAIAGRAGAGKTFTALLIAKMLGVRVALADSERGSAEKYAQKDNTPESPGNWAFDHDNLEEKNPQEYLQKISDAGSAGYDCLVLDSYSHSWLAALEMIDKGGGWQRAGKNVSPLVARVVDAILSYPGHVIATIRAKTEHVIEKDEKSGKTTMRKMGSAPVIREGTEFEFDFWFDLNDDGSVTVSKSRWGQGVPVGSIFDRGDIPKVITKIQGWLGDGAPLTPRESILDKLRFVQTMPAFNELTAEIMTQKAAGTLTPADMAAIKTAYSSKKTQIENGVSE